MRLPCLEEIPEREFKSKHLSGCVHDGYASSINLARRVQKEAQLFTYMKTFLTVSALVIAAGIPCVAFAETLGAHVPAFVNTDAIVTVFSFALIALLVLGDYARAPRKIGTSVRDRLTSAPRREAHRLAA
jgi:hypothetical protein